MKLFKHFHGTDIPVAPFEITMPSSRRSQNLPLKNFLIKIEEIFWQIQTDAAVKVKADAARKVKTDVAAKIIVDAAVKANVADAAVNVNCSRNFKKHIIDNFKAAKTREIHVIDLQRQTNAAASLFSSVVVHHFVWFLYADLVFHFSVFSSEFRNQNIVNWCTCKSHSFHKNQIISFYCLHSSWLLFQISYKKVLSDRTDLQKSLSRTKLRSKERVINEEILLYRINSVTMTVNLLNDDSRLSV